MASEGGGEGPPKSLAQMQMCFRQKTQQDQEQRRREANTARGSTALSSATPNPGKVRQMFDERRRGAGIDRSNPLKPIAPTDTPLKKAQQRLDHKQVTKAISSMSLKEPPRRFTSDNNNNKYNLAGTANRLKPVITKKTPPTQDRVGVGHKRSESSPTGKSKTAALATTTARTKAFVVRPAAGGGAPERAVVKPPTPPPKPQTPLRKIQTEAKSPKTKTQMAAPPPEGTASCRFCGRHFNTDRLEKHETVCQRTMHTKRKIFDASKQRHLGTENERYVTKKPKPTRPQTTYSSAAQQQGLNTGVKKSNWRKKHEEFIQSIRAAKQVQAHLARGGKLSDLPPPPPSENADYIQCPHCGRRFNQQAAERHIPRCANMVHNKPRRDGPPPLKKR